MLNNPVRLVDPSGHGERETGCAGSGICPGDDSIYIIAPESAAQQGQANTYSPDIERVFQQAGSAPSAAFWIKYARENKINFVIGGNGNPADLFNLFGLVQGDIVFLNKGFETMQNAAAKLMHEINHVYVNMKEGAIGACGCSIEREREGWIVEYEVVFELAATGSQAQNNARDMLQNVLGVRINGRGSYDESKWGDTELEALRTSPTFKPYYEHFPLSTRAGGGTLLKNGNDQIQ